ncbi:MAG: hypothetical protein JKY34_15055 [Kordiimonadaceae bacterium]|nr:hypothetical protein [Kordiimonadaceae bacterium]
MSDQKNMPDTDTEIGDPALWQVRDFVEETDVAPVNPVAVIIRIFRGLWMYTTVAALSVGLVAGYGAYSATNPVFESQGLVRIIARDPKILFADRDDTRLRIYDAFVASEATYMGSRTVLIRAHEWLVETINKRETALSAPNQNDFINALTIKKLKGLIAISAKSRAPYLAKKYVEALLHSYASLHAEHSGSRQTLRARELEMRVLELQAKQQNFSKIILEIGQEYDVFSLAKAHLTKVTQLEALDLRIEALATTLMEMESTGGTLNADVGDMEIKRATLLDRAMADMIFERAKRAADLAKLRLRYQPTHPKIKTLKTSLAVIDAAIESRRRLISTLGRAGAMTGADGMTQSQSLAELNALMKKLTNRRNDLSNLSRELNGKLIDLRRISEEKAQITGMLAETRRILDGVLLESRNSMPGTIDILAAGDMPEIPTTDKRKQFALLAFLAANMLTFFLVFCKRQFSAVVKYSDDLQTILPATLDISVMPSEPSNTRVAAFLSELQFSSNWQMGDATIVSIIRLSEKTDIPLDALASLAGSQGMKTLLVCAAQHDQCTSAGFSNSIKLGSDVRPIRASGFDFMSFGTSSVEDGYTLDNARTWLKSVSQNYDLILLYAGVPEKDFSARVIPNLSHINIMAVSPGVNTRVIRRTLSRLQNLKPLFTGAIQNDPQLATSADVPAIKQGKADDKAA